MKKTEMKKINKLILSLFLLFFFISCTSNVEKSINSINKSFKNKPVKSLKKLDNLYSKLKSREEKLLVLNEIEKTIKDGVRDPQLLKHVLEKKVFYSSSVNMKNKTLLDLAQLSVQNLRDNEQAQDYLFRVQEKKLNSDERGQYFQLKIISYINAGEITQAAIEIEDLLARDDLTPTERFKIEVLKTRVLSSLEKFDEMEQVFLKLLASYPNLSKKWKIRSQLSLMYEEQDQFDKALKHLKIMQKEDPKDELVEIRIEQLTKRSKQQPGGQGRLRR